MPRNPWRTAAAVSLLVVFVLLSSCGEELIFENPFDPDADGSPLGVDITGLDTFEFFDPATSEERVQFSWDRVDIANDYEYEVVQVFGYDPNTDDVQFLDPFTDIDAGTAFPLYSGSVPQPADEFTNPSVDRSAISGTYAFRVRYSATVSNNGVTASADSPWSSPYITVEDFSTNPFTDWEYYSGSGYYRDGWFNDRGEQKSYLVEPFGFGGSSFTLYIDDEFSGLPLGADTIVFVYDYADVGAGTIFQDGGGFDRVSFPYSIGIPASEQILIILESDNPGYTEFRIRIDY